MSLSPVTEPERLWLAWLALVGVVAAVVLGAAALSWLYRALYTWSGYPAP